MPRGPRLDAPGMLHHVMARGIEKGTIFIDDADRRDFMRRFAGIAVETSTEIYAFALMDNHFHFLLRSPISGLSRYMRRLLTGYALYFNKRHERVGHLFQNRFKSIVCEESLYFRKLVAYIHLNPLRGGLVGSLEQLGYYPWCGHGMLTGVLSNDWYEVDFPLSFFGERTMPARRNYQEYLADEMLLPPRDELENGVSLHGSTPGDGGDADAEKDDDGEWAADFRILGGKEFMQSVKSLTPEMPKRMALPLEERIAAAQQEIETACRESGVSIGMLFGGSRISAVVRLRRRLAVQLVQEYGLSCTETGRQLGLCPSSVNQILNAQNTRK